MINSYLLYFLEPQDKEDLHFECSMISIGYFILDERMVLMYTEKDDETIRRKLNLEECPYFLFKITSLKKEDFYSTYDNDEELRRFISEALSPINPSEKTINSILDKISKFGFENLRKNERELLSGLSLDKEK